MQKGWWWWNWVVETMTGGGSSRCQQRRVVTRSSSSSSSYGRDATTAPKEKPKEEVVPITEISSHPDRITEMPPPTKHKPEPLDFYTQAYKALSHRSPFDSEEAQASVAPLTLPHGYAQLLSRYSDNRKRQKKSNSGSEKNKSSSTAVSVKTDRSRNIWVETEEYFRELTVADIEKLQNISKVGYSIGDKCFSIPSVGSDPMCNSTAGLCHCELLSCGPTLKEELVTEEESDKEESEQFMDVDSCGLEYGLAKTNELSKEEIKEGDGKGNAEQDGERNAVGENGFDQNGERNGVKACLSGGDMFSGIEWLLGSRSKIYLTSERPSKKRKLLGGDAGLKKLLVATSVEGMENSLCHYCSLGETGNVLNRLVICGSCGMVVHQRCYGVQDDVDKLWLCSWCKQKDRNTSSMNSERPCVLCPKQGGALKATKKRSDETESSMEFAHLFCSQWIPEVYVEDTRTMEPINIEGIKDTKRKLICYLCKVKGGACVRCSNGACRTSFHPICAREAKHRMEIWGKLGCDDVELRAFCSKHSEGENNMSTLQNVGMSGPVCFDSDVTNEPVAPGVEDHHELKICQRNGDKVELHIGAANSNQETLDGNPSREDSLLDKTSNAGFQLEEDDAFAKNMLDKDINEDDLPESLKFTLILKKLVDRGKVDVNDVASEIGVSPDSLASLLMENQVVPDMHDRIIKWLSSHAFIGGLQKTLKVKFKSSAPARSDFHMAGESNCVTVTDAAVPVKSVPPRRRTKSNIRILNDDDKGEGKNDSTDETPFSCPSIELDSMEKKRNGSAEVQDTSEFSHKTEGLPENGSTSNPFESSQAKEAARWDQNAVVNTDSGNVICSVSSYDSHDIIRQETLTSSHVHPLIRDKLVGDKALQRNISCEYDGSKERRVSQFEASSSSGVCCNHHSGQLASSDLVSKFTGSHLEELIMARRMGLLEHSPADEVEGELIFHQHRLLCNAVARKRFTDDLISKVSRSLPKEIDAAGKRKWDAVLVSQYLYELKELKKQGRKERRHKEAQAVLAAATAAAAASSRNSSLRKENLEENVHQEDLPKTNASSGRFGVYSQQNLRAKETLSRSAITRVSSEKNDFQLASEASKDHSRICDICGRFETVLNSILVCSSCKVAVHLDCYRSVKTSAGPWYCELCEDLLSKGSGAPAARSWEKPYFVAECGLCGGTAGAFRKSTDGQWVHAFCAEWVLESTFRRGQQNPIEGMETVCKGSDVCLICHRKQGVCIKCSYGHCQSMFHPSCARSAGCYMNVRTGGGRMQRKVYCGKHSNEQRAKAENQKHGIEEFKSLKQIRVELERLRLLCERITKREKLKRELILCSHDILASNRDSVVTYALTRHPLFQSDISSESATTSLKGYTDGYKSGSDIVQRSDDITVDSTAAGKRRVKYPVSNEIDQRTDDSSTSQILFVHKPIDRVSFSGKHVPQRPLASRDLLDHGEKRLKYRKHTETFEKELVMTSEQASMKNQQLPKGFVYVPVRCLSNEESTPNALSGEPPEHKG